MPNLRAVAAEAGVSIATASRALSGHPRVAKDTRDRVMAAATTVGYRPNVAAQALKNNRSMLIGLLLPGVTSYFYAEVSSRIQEVLRPRGYEVILCLHQEDPTLERQHLLRLLDYQVAAVVHTPTGDRSAHSIYTELGLRIPYVVEVNRHSSDGTTDAICCTDEESVHQLTRNLIDHGHTRIGMITAKPRESTARERLAGFQAAVSEGGIAFNDGLVAAGEYTEEWGHDGLLRLLGQSNPPTAVIIPANVLVLGALRAVSELGLEIPEDFSLVTFSDFPWHSVYRPPLTSMQRPHEEMADAVCSLIAAHAGNVQGAYRSTGILRLPGELKIRASVRTLGRGSTVRHNSELEENR